jgi:hypothetical protein
MNTWYKTIILSLVLHGRETWSNTLREVHRLEAFENKVLIRICERKKQHEDGETAKCEASLFLFCTKYYMNDQMKEDEISGACRTDGRKKKCRLDSSGSG